LVAGVTILVSQFGAHAGDVQPGFKYRGIKGWCWTSEQYLQEIPVLPELKMNFLMNCYGSMYTSAPGEPPRNEWWKPMTPERKAGYRGIIECCRRNGITFCFAFHPQINSPRPLNPESAEDTKQFYQHYAWAQSQGVHWFSVSLDDVGWDQGGPEAGGLRHARFVNTIFSWLRRNDPLAQMIFCPGPYWGDGREPRHRPYLEAVGRELQPDIYVFWTGDAVVTSRITRAAAASYKSIVKHRLFLWDNYPVNDGNSTLHLGPVMGRDPDLCEVIDGYISNPMATQNEINRLPLATCADYAFNPRDYDPARSLDQSIARLSATDTQREAMRSLVSIYPGFLATGGGTGSNPVRDKFNALLCSGKGKSVLDFLQGVKDISAHFEQEFPNQFLDARRMVLADIAWMNSKAKTIAFPNL